MRKEKIHSLFGKGKLLSLLLTATLFTACNDEEDYVTGGASPIKLAVETADVHARAPIFDATLPDAAQIGINVTDADGKAYDGVTYSNVAYVTTGTGSSQTWAPVSGSAIMLSSTPAKLVAYYPYAEGTNLTAIPVETATQTDYMFSGAMTGITNANPEVTITMQHALTAVRVALVKGSFTGSANVTEVKVKSPAFGTAASLNAETGALADITGQGDAVTIAPNFALAAEATNTDVLLVPDVSVTSGKTNVSVKIGENQYTADIDFTESYKQGYIYTYTLTLNNKGMELMGVDVTPWNTGTSAEGELVPDKFAEALIATFEIDDVSQPVYVISPNFVAANDIEGQDNRVIAMNIDGIDVTPTYTWQFTQPGKHVVKYILSDMTHIPDNFFAGELINRYYEASDYQELVDNRKGLYASYVASRNAGVPFQYFPYLVKVEMPDTFSSIGTESFEGCHDLKEVVFSNILQVIGRQAFVDCSSLEELILPASVKHFQDYGDSNTTAYIDITGMLKLKKIEYDTENFEKDTFHGYISITPLLKYFKAPNVSNVKINISYYESTGCVATLYLGDKVENVQIIINGEYGVTSNFNMIISESATASTFNIIENGVNLPETGKVIVPTGATGYDAWMEQLPTGWSIQYVEDMDAKITEVKQKIEEEIFEIEAEMEAIEALKQEYAEDYANGIKMLPQLNSEYKIFNENFDLNLVKRMFVTDMNTGIKNVIDVTGQMTLANGQLITVTLKDPTAIPDGIFKGVTPYMGIVFPECLESIGNEAFAGSNVLMMAFMSENPPTVTENSLTGLTEEFGQDGGILYPSNESNDYTAWETILGLAPECWQKVAMTAEEMITLKNFFIY